MAKRRGGTGDAGIADENIELATAVVQRRAKPCDAVGVGQVERHQRGAAAVLSDLVVEFLKPALRARHGDNMRAGFGERARRGVADAARGAGDESDAVGKGFCHDPDPRLRRVLQTWMAGTSPAMTKNTVRRSMQYRDPGFACHAPRDDASRQLASASNDN